MSKKTLLLFLLLIFCLAYPLAAQPDPISDENADVTRGTDGLPWWNDRVFYQIFVRSFYDSDGDGTGDIRGIIEKLDYLNDGDPTTTGDLGVTGLWLMPVTQSPSYHGYDVIDYFTIEQDYGTNEDFLALMEAAHERDMVVIVDLVMNHTSTAHPWFIDSRRGGSEYDDWYIWEDQSPGFSGPWGQQVWHRAGDRLYYGVFWSGMPDLNYSNPDVTAAMYDIIEFWLDDMNVDGFRLDAIIHLIENGRVQENTPASHAWLQGFHDFVRSVDTDAVLVGEAWTETDEVLDYIGDEVDIAFEFDLASAIIRSVQFGSSSFVKAHQQMVNAEYPHGQYGAFLTNHDQNRIMSVLRGDEGKAKVGATILLTNPGVPFIYYGEEIGMVGEKPDERIRTPMQWTTTGGTGGFTTGRPWEALQNDHPMVNVAAQTDDPDSLLNHYQSLIHVRNDSPALRAGSMTMVESDAGAVYAFLRQSDEETVLVVINLSDDPVEGYVLSLSEGSFDQGGSQTLPYAELLYGEDDVIAPEINAAGGFDAYTPVDVLPPYSSFVIRLG